MNNRKQFHANALKTRTIDKIKIESVYSSSPQEEKERIANLSATSSSNTSLFSDKSQEIAAKSKS